MPAAFPLRLLNPYNGESTWRTYSVTLHTHPTADSKESSTLRGSSGTYGYIYDDKNEVIAIQPVREVYPQNGFDMLMTAYSNALSDNPLTPDKFLESYCHTRLGLGPQEETEVVRTIST